MLTAESAVAVVYEGDRLTLRDPISPNKLLGNYGSTFCWFRDKAYGHFFRKNKVLNIQ